ncbi:ATP-binding protein [Streptomyces mirabilis]|uniref:ATP-binding protein n=1 Tax=Streptomyces mirabilis TaxID=68239 RepID=UPI002B1CAC7F|nr:ATP-binding protein [Streptomyces mirabilis]
MWRSSARSANTSPDTSDHVESPLRGQLARRVRRAGTGKPAPETVQGVPSPTQHIPFESEAANLFFQLVSNRYERASVIVTSNKPFGRWGEVFGDETVAAAMIDRLVHHAEVHSLKGDSYRMRGRQLGRVPTATHDTD